VGCRWRQHPVTSYCLSTVPPEYPYSMRHVSPACTANFLSDVVCHQPSVSYPGSRIAEPLGIQALGGSVRGAGVNGPFDQGFAGRW